MRRAFGVVIARVRVGCTKRRRSPFIYAVVVVVVAACGGRCEGEGEVDEATALTVHVRRCHHCCRHVWRDEVGEDDARHRRRHCVWRDDASASRVDGPGRTRWVGTRRDEQRRCRRHIWRNTARVRRRSRRVWGKTAVSSCGGDQRGTKGQRGRGLVRRERERTMVTTTASALLHHRGVGEDDSIVVAPELYDVVVVVVSS